MYIPKTMSHEILLTGTPKKVALVFVGLIFFLLLLNSALVHFNKPAIAGLNRKGLIEQIGPRMGREGHRVDCR